VSDTQPGPDGAPRCPWAVGSADYLAYHDTEWGVPVRDDHGLLERVCLEGFQAGLSWLIVLRRRDALRAAFAGFDADALAAFTPEQVEEALAAPGVIRNRAKAAAMVGNARAALALPGGLAALVWSFAPSPRPRPRVLADVPAVTEESAALAAALRTAGFRFVGPTSCYALMQACGLVDDHLDGCCVPLQGPRRSVRSRRSG